jgi:hypothetical protein
VLKKAVLTKEAVRCSDLRKAVILIYLKLKDIQPDGMLMALFHSAVEITNLCYAHDDNYADPSNYFMSIQSHISPYLSVHSFISKSQIYHV